MEPKKIVGIIGGMGSVAAVKTFERFIELQPAVTDQDYLEVFLHNNSRVPDRTAGIIGGAESPLAELRRSVAICNRFEVDAILLACMTSHSFLPQLQPGSAAPIIDGIAETARHIVREHADVRRVGILATTGNIRCGLFQRALEAEGITPVVFDDADQQHFFMDPVYEPWGIKAGHVTGAPKQRVLAAVDRLAMLGAQAVIAGCTEIPLVLEPGDVEIPVVSSIDCMCRAAIDFCNGSQGSASAGRAE